MEKAKKYADVLLDGIERHREDLVIADYSKNGWQTVNRLRNRCSLNSDLLKKLERLDDQIDSRKKRFNNSRNDGRTYKRAGNVDYKTFRGINKSYKPGFKPYQKMSPEH